MIKSRLSIPSFLAAASVLFCVVSTAKAQDKVLLRMNLQPGQTFDQGYAMEMKVFGAVPKQPMDMTTTGQFGIHLEVLGVDDDGNIKLKATYQTIVSKTQGVAGGKAIPAQNYDSKNPPKNIPAGLDSLAGMVGMSLVETMSPQGKILKVEGLDAIVQKIMAKNKDTVMRDATSQVLKESIEGKSKEVSSMIKFPESPIAVGDSWTNVVSLPILPQLTMKYTLMSSQNGVATIAVRADFSPNPITPNLKTPLPPMKISISGTETGVMRVDEKTGLTISSELNMRMKDVTSMTKSTSKSKTKPAKPSAITVYMKGTMHGWTVKLPQ